MVLSVAWGEICEGGFFGTVCSLVAEPCGIDDATADSDKGDEGKQFISERSLRARFIFSRVN